MAKPTTGELKHRVALQKKTGRLDPVTKLEVNHWETYNNVWAKIETNAGMTFQQSSYQQEPIGSHTITIRDGAQVSRDTRIFYKGKSFKIISLDSFEYPGFITIEADQVDGVIT